MIGSITGFHLLLNSSNFENDNFSPFFHHKHLARFHAKTTPKLAILGLNLSANQGKRDAYLVMFLC